MPTSILPQNQDGQELDNAISSFIEQIQKVKPKFVCKLVFS